MAKQRKTTDDTPDQGQLALDHEALLERVATLEKARAAVDAAAKALADAQREVRHQRRKVQEASWNLAFWQRQVEQCPRRAGGANGSET